MYCCLSLRILLAPTNYFSLLHTLLRARSDILQVNKSSFCKMRLSNKEYKLELYELLVIP